MNAPSQTPESDAIVVNVDFDLNFGRKGGWRWQRPS